MMIETEFDVSARAILNLVLGGENERIPFIRYKME